MSGVETAMCSYNIWSDPPAQTGMMHTSPNPICTSQWAKCTKLPSHWCHKETENAILSGDETTRSPHTIWFFGNFIFFYQRKIVSTEMTSGKTLLIILLDRLMIYISLITFLTHATVCRMCSSMKQHGARQYMKYVHIHRWENFKNMSKTQSEIVHCLIPFSYETPTRSYPPCCCHTHPTTVIPPFLSRSPVPLLGKIWKFLVPGTSWNGK